MEKKYIKSVEEMQIFGQALSRRLKPGDIVFLEGGLGAGKTTLVRGILQGMEYCGAVKSPTFTLVESYIDLPVVLHHFDLYRVNHPEELELLGWRDYFSHDAINVIEWPKQAGQLLPKPHYRIEIEHDDITTRIVFVEKIR